MCLLSEAEDAEFIVQAVNSHENLVAALQALIGGENEEMADDVLAHYLHVRLSDIIQARTALAKATKKEEP